MRDPGTVGHVDIDRLVTFSACPSPVIKMRRTTAVVMTILSGVVRVVGWSDVKRHGEPSRAIRVITVFIVSFIP